MTKVFVNFTYVTNNYEQKLGKVKITFCFDIWLDILKEWGKKPSYETNHEVLHKTTFLFFRCRKKKQKTFLRGWPKTNFPSTFQPTY